MFTRKMASKSANMVATLFRPLGYSDTSGACLSVETSLLSSTLAVDPSSLLAGACFLDSSSASCPVVNTDLWCFSLSSLSVEGGEDEEREGVADEDNMVILCLTCKPGWD